MHSSALGAAALTARRSFSSASRLSIVRRPRYSSIVRGVVRVLFIRRFSPGPARIAVGRETVASPETHRRDTRPLSAPKDPAGAAGGPRSARTRTRRTPRQSRRARKSCSPHWRTGHVRRGPGRVHDRPPSVRTARSAGKGQRHISPGRNVVLSPDHLVTVERRVWTNPSVWVLLEGSRLLNFYTSADHDHARAIRLVRANFSRSR